MFDLHGTKLYNVRKAVFLAGILLAAALTTLLLSGKNKQNAWYAETDKVLIIDAGHGGIDGGAIAADGTRESVINLAVALRMQALAELTGQKYIMTRTQDVSLSDPQKYSEHEDLVLRAGIAAGTPGAVLISIHQNCYITPQPSGVQTLYAGDSESERLGKLIHENFCRFLEPGNRRLAEPAPKKLFLTANAGCPTVLMECGFMSNPGDLEKLKDSDQQTRIAAVILISFLKFSENQYT